MTKSIHIAMHPQTFHDLTYKIMERENWMLGAPQRGGMRDMMLGIEIRRDPCLNCYIPAKWKFPKERFVTYQKSDESWCRYFGIGKEIPEVMAEIVIRRDLPVYHFSEFEQHRYYYSDNALSNRVGYNFEDREYEDATRALEWIWKMLGDEYGR